MLKNYMKTLLIIIGMVCIITGCDNAEKNHSDNKKEDVIEKSTSAEDGVLTVDAIKKSEKFLKFFSSKNLSVTEVTLDKRQTNINNKEDIAYLHVKAENSEVMCDEVLVVTSTYFDVGGWQVSNILTENLFEYEPKGVPDIKIEDAEVTNVALTDDIYNCLVTFKKTASGSVADITETYNRKYVFNKGTGNWNMYSDYHDDEFISYDIKVKAKDGMYLPKWYADNNKRPPEKYDLKFYGNKATLTYYSYSTLNYEYTTSNRGEAVIEMVRVTSPYTFDKECIYYYKFVNNVNAVFIQIDEDNIYANIGRRGDSPTGYRGSQLVLK